MPLCNKTILQNGGEMDDLNIQLDRKSKESISTQIAAQIRDGIKNGKLKTGDRLPPITAVANKLGISIETVRRAYNDLKDERLVMGKSTNGTFIGNSEVDKTSSPKRKVKKATRRGRRSEVKVESIKSSPALAQARGRREAINLLLEEKKKIEDQLQELGHMDTTVRRRGRPPGSKNKRGRGRPKGSKNKRGPGRPPKE
jgi:DNA-binding transcriptional regulator YhcF (GntR family)